MLTSLSASISSTFACVLSALPSFSFVPTDFHSRPLSFPSSSRARSAAAHSTYPRHLFIVFSRVPASFYSRSARRSNWDNKSVLRLLFFVLDTRWLLGTEESFMPSLFHHTLCSNIIFVQGVVVIMVHAQRLAGFSCKKKLKKIRNGIVPLAARILETIKFEEMLHMHDTGFVLPWYFYNYLKSYWEVWNTRMQVVAILFLFNTFSLRIL